MKHVLKWILALCALLIAPTSYAFSPPTIVTSFNAAALEAPENLWIDDAGNRYVTLALTGEVRKITPAGVQSTFVQFDLGAPPLTPCYPALALPVPVLTGITADLFGNYYFAVKSCDRTKSGLWKRSPNGALTLLFQQPEGSLLNGIDYFFGNLYAADTFGAAVWKVSPFTGAATIWTVDPLLAPRPGSPLPGPNGLKVFRDDVYVAVSDTALILAFRILPSGLAGAARVHAQLGTPGTTGCDDFSFDLLGNLYCGTDPFGTLLKISPAGMVTTLLTTADGLDGPTATFFGRGCDSTTLYITNGAFPFFSVTHNPTLMALDVGIPGTFLR